VDTEGAGVFTSLAFNTTGPAISYRGAGLKYAWQDGSGWHIETVDGGDVPSYISLAFNATGYPAISYFALYSHDLKYAW
jgi:hypothetical protein